jgi:hypothetical protein
MKTKAAVKKTVWVVMTDTDDGNNSSVYATKKLGEAAYIEIVNIYYNARDDQRYGPDAKTFKQAQKKAQKAVDHGSLDFVWLNEEEIEGYDPKLHVVLAVYGGVPEDPEVFTDEKAAEARYIALANEMYGRPGKRRKFKTIEEVHDYRNTGNTDDDIYLYETEVK